MCIISKPSVNSNLSYSPETLNMSLNRRFVCTVFHAAFSVLIHFIAISEFKVELQSGNAHFGSFQAPLLSNIKLCASLHRHIKIQAGVMVRKRLNWVMNSVTLTFDLDLLHGHHLCHHLRTDRRRDRKKPSEILRFWYLIDNDKIRWHQISSTGRRVLRM